MDIKTLEAFRLQDAIKFHDELNSKLFINDRLRPEVKKQLLLIAEDFVDELGIDDLDIKDITISGSNAAYSYTPYSDLDLHILVDISKLNNNDVYAELFNAKKTVYNDSHDIKIHNIPVELYVQDANIPLISLGEYSLLQDKWLRIPTKRRANLDQTATKSKYEKLLELINYALKTQKYSTIKKTIDTIKRYRKTGLARGGEFGPENLAYKMVRNQGYIDKLYNLRDKLHSEKLTIENMYDTSNLYKDDIDEMAAAGNFANRIWYHGTSLRNYKKILQSGIVKPSVADAHDVGPAIWLASDPSDALSYGPIVLAISNDKLKNFKVERWSGFPHGFIKAKKLGKPESYTMVIKEPVPLRMFKRLDTTTNKLVSIKNEKIKEAGSMDESASGKNRLDIQYYMNEGCGIFAVAKALTEPNSQIYIISNKHGESWSKSFPYEITHVFVNLPGEGQFDVKGKRSPEEMVKDFTLDKNDYFIKGPFNPHEFLKKFMGNSDSKPLYGTANEINQLKNKITTDTTVESASGYIPSTLEETQSTDFRELLKNPAGDKLMDTVPKFLYHATPVKNVDSILSKGLELRADNIQDKYQPRIYLATSVISAIKIANQLRKALKINEDYIVLKINTSKLKNKFYIDAYFSGGVYTDNPIASSAISTQMKIPREAFKSKKNWAEFWNWVMWDKKKPNFANESASGYIPNNSEKNDPRYKTALTVDIKPNSLQKNAKKLGSKISRSGIPPLLRP